MQSIDWILSHSSTWRIQKESVFRGWWGLWNQRYLAVSTVSNWDWEHPKYCRCWFWVFQCWAINAANNCWWWPIELSAHRVLVRRSWWREWFCKARWTEYILQSHNRCIFFDFSTSDELRNFFFIYCHRKRVSILKRIWKRSIRKEQLSVFEADIFWSQQRWKSKSWWLLFGCIGCNESVEREANEMLYECAKTNGFRSCKRSKCFWRGKRSRR